MPAWALISWKPVGLVTLISVRQSPITSSPARKMPRSRAQGAIASAISRSRSESGCARAVPPAARLPRVSPALGMRAIRLSLSHEKIFRAQLRAILEASYENHLDILLPMISDISEILDAKAILKQEKSRLERRKKKLGNPKIGAMIEVPSAVLMVEEIAQEVDFLCVGTNDLVQYLLGVDRDNELVADWFRTLNPSVLRSLKMVMNASEKYQKPTIICGEMAGSHVYVPILLGLGVTELSMHVNAMPRVRQIISNIAFEEAQTIVKSLETCRTADEVEATLREHLFTKWAHLYPSTILPPAKKRV